MTPLHHACASEHDNIEILKLLIDNSADVDALNNALESPLRVAINKKGPYSAKANYIRARGGKDIGPRAVQLGRSGPLGPPQPPPPSQDYNTRMFDIVSSLEFSPVGEFTLVRSTSPPGFSWISEDALSHRAKLERIAAQCDLLDDYKPSDFNSLSPADKRTVVDMAADMNGRSEAEQVHRRLHPSLMPLERDVWGRS
jgi:hypothetical protein